MLYVLELKNSNYHCVASYPSYLYGERVHLTTKCLALCTSLLYREWYIVSLSSNKCTNCKLLWIKASAKWPKCKWGFWFVEQEPSNSMTSWVSTSATVWWVPCPPASCPSNAPTAVRPSHRWWTPCFWMATRRCAFVCRAVSTAWKRMIHGCLPYDIQALWSGESNTWNIKILSLVLFDPCRKHGDPT